MKASIGLHDSMPGYTDLREQPDLTMPLGALFQHRDRYLAARLNASTAFPMLASSPERLTDLTPLSMLTHDKDSHVLPVTQ